MRVRVTAVGVLILAILGGLASVTALLQWCDVGPPKIAQPPSTFELTEDILDFSDTLVTADTSLIDELIPGLEESCRQGRFDVAEIKCWIILGQLHAVESRNRTALALFDRAQEIDPKIADPYYARGNIYYGLALMDLLRKRRFEMSAEELALTVRPDDDSRQLFEKAIDEYARADGLTTIEELNPSDTTIVTSLTRIAHRERQIESFFEGSDAIILHRMELLEGVALLMRMYPDDETLLPDTLLMLQTVMACMSAHPEDFPGFIREVYESGGSMGGECPY